MRLYADEIRSAVRRVALATGHDLVAMMTLLSAPAPDTDPATAEVSHPPRSVFDWLEDVALEAHINTRGGSAVQRADVMETIVANFRELVTSMPIED